MQCIMFSHIQNRTQDYILLMMRCWNNTLSQLDEGA